MRMSYFDNPVTNGVLVDDTTAGDSTTGTVSPSPTLILQLEEVQVSTLVDTRSQTTVIARLVLHDIGRHLQKQGKVFT